MRITLFRLDGIRGYKNHEYGYGRPSIVTPNHLKREFDVAQPNEAWVTVHADQGSQYGSDEWHRFCCEHNLMPSMSRKGNCWDNAVAESFFSSLKKERIKKRIYKTRVLARADIFDYIEMFNNKTKRHTYLGVVSPEQFEQASI